MSYANPFLDFAWGELFDTVLPDFVLAFTFFTAIIYAVLGRRFGQQRPAVAMSAALGLALAVGLVWWERTKGLSIRNLGPLAVGFAVIILAGVIYQAIKHVGGSWAGAAIAFGASILIGWLLGLDWRADSRLLQTVIAVTLGVGIIAFLLHRRGSFDVLARAPAELANIRHDTSDLHKDRRVSKRLKRGLRDLGRQAGSLVERPEGADDVMLQLQRMLPAEGWLTERMARLREHAQHARAGDLHRIEELRATISKLPPEAQHKAAQELAARYKELNLDVRLERLDRAVAENERRVRELTRHAQLCLQEHEYRKLTDVLAAAAKLQKHNARLLKLIERTEQRLLKTAKDAGKNAPSGVSHD